MSKINEFQFQYGSIISKKLLKKYISTNLFQFQYGSIIRRQGN